MKEQQPRHRRLDLINSMPKGKQKEIARRLKCSTCHVSMVLNGKRSQTNELGINIIRLAEYSANAERIRWAVRNVKRF